MHIIIIVHIIKIKFPEIMDIIISCKFSKVEKNIISYKEDTIPKQNLGCLRYREIPQNVKAEDVSKYQRARIHIKDSL